MNKNRITATKTLSGYEYTFDVGGGRWEHKAMDVIVFELLAEGFTRRMVANHFAMAHTLALQTTSLANEFVLEIVFGLRRKARHEHA